MLRYTADELWALRRDDVTPPRRARKTIFKHRLWQPRGQREYQARRLRRSGFSHSTLIDRTTNGIRVDLLNVRSVAKRFIAISDIITSRCLDVFALTETWHRASNDMSLKRCAPPGYSIVDAACSHSETRGGGIALIHSNRFVARRLKLDVKPSTFEVLGCSLRSAFLDVVYVVIYRPGSEALTS